MEIERKVSLVRPGTEFNQELWLAPGIWTTEMCPNLKDFMLNWSNAAIIESYTRRHPEVRKEGIESILSKRTVCLHHAGLDLILAKNMETGSHEFLTIETNSCPAGLESMPPDMHAYETHLNSSFFDQKKWKMRKSEGSLAFMFEDIKLDTPSFPHFMAKIAQENVYMLPWYSEPDLNGNKKSFVRFNDGIMYVKDGVDVEGKPMWAPIRACFRRSIAHPWARIPVTNNFKTFMYPHPIACLAGGKNKLLANFAYEQFNDKYKKFGLEIKTPKTVSCVQKNDIREIVRMEFGFRAIIKTPYSSQGRGIYVIRQESDVDEFLKTDTSKYDLFLIQDLIGLDNDICNENPGRYRHVGYTAQDGSKYAYTLRMIVTDSPAGYKLFGVCGTRSATPFFPVNKEVDVDYTSYMTNIGPVSSGGIERDIPANATGVKGMGFTRDDIMDAYLQCVMSILAIDQVCQDLINEDGHLNFELLKILNPDPVLLREVKECIEANSSIPFM